MLDLKKMRLQRQIWKHQNEITFNNEGPTDEQTTKLGYGKSMNFHVGALDVPQSSRMQRASQTDKYPDPSLREESAIIDLGKSESPVVWRSK